MFLMLLMILAMFLIYIHTNDKLTYWKKRKVYSVKPIPFFGNLLSVAFGKDDFWHTIRKIYTRLDDNHPYFGFYIFHKPLLIVKDRKIIKQILNEDFNSFPNRTLHSNKKTDPLMSNTLFVLKDGIWRRTRRKITNNILTSGKMKEMVSLMKNISNNLRESIAKTQEGTIDIRELAKCFFCDSFSTFILGIDFGMLKNENPSVKEANDKVFDQVSVMRRISAFFWVFCPIFADIFRLSFLDMTHGFNFINAYLRAEEERKQTNIKRNDLLDLMIELSEENNEYDDVRRAAQAALFYGNGTDATAFTTALCLYELALHPDIQDELRNEIYQNMDVDGDISYEALHKMEFLDLVVKESLRLHPFLPFITRYASTDYTIESTGLIVEKGTQVLIPVDAIHTDPKYYTEPAKFNPERFRENKVKDLRYLYMPFGEGPRMCIAERMAVTAVKFGLSAFLKNIEVSIGQTELPIKLERNTIFATPKDGCVILKMKKIEK